MIPNIVLPTETAVTVLLSQSLESAKCSRFVTPVQASGRRAWHLADAAGTLDSSGPGNTASRPRCCSASTRRLQPLPLLTAESRLAAQGGIDSGGHENPMSAAVRELKEETGITSARIVALVRCNSLFSSQPIPFLGAESDNALQRA